MLIASATTGSEAPAVAICPLVVDYSREFQARAADEIDLLSERSAIAEMLSDYAATQEQARTRRSG